MHLRVKRSMQRFVGEGTPIGLRPELQQRKRYALLFVDRSNLYIAINFQNTHSKSQKRDTRELTYTRKTGD